MRLMLIPALLVTWLALMILPPLLLRLWRMSRPPPQIQLRPPRTRRPRRRARRG